MPGCSVGLLSELVVSDNYHASVGNSEHSAVADRLLVDWEEVDTVAVVG